MVRFKKKVILEKNTYIGFSSTFEGKNRLKKNVYFSNSQLGLGSYISENSRLSNTRIGKYCSLGPDIKCIFGQHPTRDFVSTHPAFFSTLKQAGFTYTKTQTFKDFAPLPEPEEKFSIIIGNDVWIGAEVSIIEGVKIGDGAIIAARSLVTKDIPPYSVYGGIPAKFIKSRFTSEEIEFLTKLKWWDKPEDWLIENQPNFENISLLMNKYQSKI
ncbi:CatB-related O-acetyltransferase [Robertkochia sp. 1368]|nr:CatB-related O-acetyltransferase [Robertkochia sediminum]